MTLSPELQQKCVNTIRTLAIDGVEKANSGHPGMPMGAAPMAFTLWNRHLRYDPRNPRWANRDRFILSAGHGSMLIYSLLHLAGFDVTLDDLKNFRQLHSKTPGHPEFGETPGVECTTGPLGAGLSNAVGFALSARMLAARVNKPASNGFVPIDHYVYGICSDGDLMEGVTAEACSIAGHLGLGNLIFFYDDNHISIEGQTEITFTEDRMKRYEAYGWHVQTVHDGNDLEALHRALEAAKAETRKPSMIAVRTVIGFGSPSKAGTRHAHGEPLGKDETIKTKAALGWPTDSSFLIPDDVAAVWKARGEELISAADQWKADFALWAKEHPVEAELWGKLESRAVPADLAEQLAEAVKGITAAESTRKISQAVIQKAGELVPSMVGGSADLEPSTFTAIKNGGDVDVGKFGGRVLHFGVREHGMGSVVNGLAYDGFFIPYSATFLLFSDYMRPPIRLASLSHLRSIFVFTHDSIFLGEDGPTHQPIEQLASLRAIPNLEVWRPADPLETAAMWASALEREHGPSLFSLSRQKLAPLVRTNPVTVKQVQRGAYTVVEPQLAAGEKPKLVVISTGSELANTQASLQFLPEDLRAKTRIVSMPCVERFMKWPKPERDALIPQDVKTAAIEAAGGLDWYRIVGRDGLVHGIEKYGASAPEKALAEAYGFTPQHIAGQIKAWLGIA
ncbi:MAG: transketolase [Deltaproteobacteria bacterium]|nr:transketolase [Deltaproteobacteria bacterium]